MTCPRCRANQDTVFKSRECGPLVRRRRKCLVCGYRWTTFEVEGQGAVMIDHDPEHPCVPAPNEAATAYMPLFMLEPVGYRVEPDPGSRLAHAEVVVCGTCGRVVGPFYRMGVDGLVDATRGEQHG